MGSENVEIVQFEGTTAQIAALTYKNSRWAFDTDKDHAVAYKADGSTLRHFVMTDSSGAMINSLAAVPIIDGSWLGLGDSKGRIEFDDEGTDLITIKAAAFLVEDYIQGSRDVDDANFPALILKNINNPATGETGQSVSIQGWLRKTIDGGANYSDEEAGEIIFGKDADFFHASTEADCDGNIKFQVSVNGTMAEKMRVTSSGVIIGAGLAAADSILHAWVGSAGAVAAYVGTIITAESNGAAYISILCPQGSLSGIYFGMYGGDSFNRYFGITCNHTSGVMTFRAADSNIATLDGSSSPNCFNVAGKVQCDEFQIDTAFASGAVSIEGYFHMKVVVCGVVTEVHVPCEVP